MGKIDWTPSHYAAIAAPAVPFLCHSGLLWIKERGIALLSRTRKRLVFGRGQRASGTKLEKGLSMLLHLW